MGLVSRGGGIGFAQGPWGALYAFVLMPMSSEIPVDYAARFRALSRLAIAAAQGESARRLLELAVDDAVAGVGLSAGSVRIFGDSETDRVTVIRGDEAASQRMAELEETLLAPLRRNWSVRSLYMTLDLDGPSGLFSYPLRVGEQVVGAISGMARGERSLAVEEEFVSGLAAMIVLIGRTGPSWGSELAQLSLERESQIKTQAVLETGAALSHEINNPLMAVLGNLELLLRKSPPHDADTMAKLAKVHEAADRIRRATQALMRITDARSTTYPGGGAMIDIEGSPKRDS